MSDGFAPGGSAPRRQSWAGGRGCSAPAAGWLLAAQPGRQVVCMLAPSAGTCAALAYDSVTPASQVGLPMLNAPPAYVDPYGVAISRGDAGSELEHRLVYALTG